MSAREEIPRHTEGCHGSAQGTRAGWSCTDHTTWLGETLHVAAWTFGGEGEIGCVWFDEKRFIECPSGQKRDGWTSWSQVENELVKRFAPVSEKELLKAQRGLLELEKKLSEQ